MQLTTDYAVRIVIYLYQNKTQLSTAFNMSQELGISYQYFMKITNKLKNAGIVESTQGRNGGYLLTNNAYNLSLYDILVIMEGEFKLNRCLYEDNYCSRNASSYCKVHQTLYIVQNKLVNELMGIKIADLCS